MKEIGDKLKATRLSLGLSIQDISNKTKIRHQVLTELEAGNFSFQPMVYVISFLKTYSQFLKISDEEIDDFLNILKKQANIPKPAQYQVFQANKTNDLIQKFNTGNYKKLFSQKSNIVNYLIYAALGLIVVSLIYVTFFSGTKDDKKFIGEKGVYGPDTAVIKNQRGNLENFFAPPDSIVLEAVGIDTAWIRLIIDGTQTDQVLMVPRLEKKWIAKNYFQMSIGNEGAVQFKRNGTLLPPFGTKGSIIRNVRITFDKVDVSSSPWSNPKDTTTYRRAKKKQEAVPAPPIRLLEPSSIQKSDVKIKK